MFTPPTHENDQPIQPSNGLARGEVPPGPYPFSLAPGEVVKRVYPMVHVRGLLGKMSGVLFVTDARILYRADSKSLLGSSTLHSEIQMSDVAGITLDRKRGWGLDAAIFVFLSVPWIVLWFALASWDNLLLSASGSGVAGTDVSSTDSTGFNWFLLFAWVSVGVLLLGLRALVYERRGFHINSRQQGVAAIRIDSGVDEGSGLWIVEMIRMTVRAVLARFGVVDAGGSVASGEANDVEYVYSEIGALILDLQAWGSLGAEDRTTDRG